MNLLMQDRGHGKPPRSRWSAMRIAVAVLFVVAAAVAVMLIMFNRPEGYVSP